MNLQLLSRALCQPWAIRSLELAALTQLVISTPDAAKSGMRELALSGPVASGTRATEKTKAQVSRRISAAVPGNPVSSTATVIQIFGVLGRGWEEWEKYYFGAVDVDDLIEQIESTPAGSTVVLWFRSPGGIITGIPEFASYLRSAVKRRTIIAFTDDLCASAAYWLASQCSLIVATPTAYVGSIGVYIAFYDWTEFLAKQGISLELFKAGRLKAMGLPGNPLSDEEAALLQGQVNESYAQFTADVLRNREIDTETMQGQCFRGKSTLDANLVDLHLPSFDVFCSALAKGQIPV